MSQHDSTSLTKTCMNCGQQKHLSAFLEMSGTEGTAYGNICSTCRKTMLDELQRRKKTEAEGSTTTESGHKIDTKAKVQGTIDKRELVQRTDEEYHAERKVDAEDGKEKKQVKFNTESGQRKHREDFLKKRPFLGKDSNSSGKQTTAQQLRTEMLRGNEANAQQSSNRYDDRIKTEHDFTVANQGQQISGQIRFSGQTYQQFRQWLGNSAPIVNNLNQTKKDPAPKQAGSIAQPVTQTKIFAKEEKGKDPAVEFIEQNWRPGSKR